MSKTYAENHTYREEVRGRAKARRSRNKAVWVSALGGQCIDCGVADPRVLHFDHVDPTTKAKPIASLMARLDPFDAELAAECRKCVLRCANCHLIKSVVNGELGRRRKYPGDPAPAHE